MTIYQKINAPFMRDMQAPGKPLKVGWWALPEFEYLANNQWEFTEKVDGTNIRVIIDRLDDFVTVDFKGRTDNADIPTELRQYLERTFTRDSVSVLFASMSVDELENTSSKIVLYGEGYGPKIQGGGKYRNDSSFVLFDVNFDGWWLYRENVNDIARKLGIDAVPVIGSGTLWDGIQVVKESLRSSWGDFEAEGIVARPTVMLFDRKGQRIIAKIKAKDFR